MENNIRFEATESLRMSNSFVTVREEENIKLDVSINIKDERGSFEIYDIKTGGEDWHAEGGLWFKGKDLVDYDGVFALPKCIESKLTELEYNLDKL